MSSIIFIFREIGYFLTILYRPDGEKVGESP